MKSSLPALLIPLAVAGCIETKHTIVIDQPKPMVVKLEVSGHFDIVIKDARDNLEKITGEKPTNEVNLKDIGLAPSPSPSSRLVEEDRLFLARVADRSAPPARLYEALAQDDPKAAMAARNPQIRALWDSKAVGEGYDGMLSARSTLTAEQQKLMGDENRDRAALYAAEAAAKKVDVKEVALSYYVARLGYAKNGNWYQKRNDAGTWEWKQWGM